MKPPKVHRSATVTVANVRVKLYSDYDKITATIQDPNIPAHERDQYIRIDDVDGKDTYRFGGRQFATFGQALLSAVRQTIRGASQTPAYGQTRQQARGRVLESVRRRFGGVSNSVQYFDEIDFTFPSSDKAEAFILALGRRFSHSSLADVGLKYRIGSTNVRMDNALALTPQTSRDGYQNTGRRRRNRRR